MGNEDLKIEDISGIEFDDYYRKAEYRRQLIEEKAIDRAHRQITDISDGTVEGTDKITGTVAVVLLQGIIGAHCSIECMFASFGSSLAKAVYAIVAEILEIIQVNSDGNLEEAKALKLRIAKRLINSLSIEVRGN